MPRKKSISGTHIVLASSTSPHDTGLLAELVEAYHNWTELKTVRVDVVAVGTGLAMEIAKRGDADILLTHDPDSEKEFIKEGHGVNYYDLMYDDYIIVGPDDDPAKIMKSDSAVDAFRRLDINNGAFISRGDESGTHIREKRLWRAAGIDPRSREKYISAGSGMEKTLRAADEMSAYTLCDMATFLKIKDELVHVMQVFSGDPDLYNQYSIMAANPARFANTHYKEALDFISFATGDEGQNIIRKFTDKQGSLLFTPNSNRKGEVQKVA
ncbi:MAG TPA: substrate-binding domain-containing protein [Nitrospirota bacterium]|jgi:tungstate transport system substrate-binding protein